MDTTNKVYTVTDSNGYTWRGSNVAKGAKINAGDATPAEVEQLNADTRGAHAKLSGPAKS